MSNIQENLHKIIHAVWGKDVRQAIHDAIHDCYEDGSSGSIDLIAREDIEELEATKADRTELAQETADRLAEVAVERGRIDNLITSGTGVTNATKRTETTLFNSTTPCFGNVSGNSGYFNLLDSIDGFDYIKIRYSAFGKTGIVECKPADVSASGTLGSGAFHWSEIQPTVEVSGDPARSTFRHMDFYAYNISSGSTNRLSINAVVYGWTGDASANGKVNESFTPTWNSTNNIWTASGFTGGIYSITGIKYEDAGVNKDTEVTDLRTGADGTVYNTAGEAVRTQITQIIDGFDGVKSIFGEDYDSEDTYSVGDRCIYGGKWYECNTAISTAEEWNSAHWDAINLGDVVDQVNTNTEDIATNTADIDALKEDLTNLSSSQYINFFNPNDPDFTEGKLIDGYGTLTTVEYMDVSGYIPIEPNVEYEVPIYKGKIGESARAIPIYDANKNYIQRLVSSDYSDTTKRLKFVTTNENARYTRVNVAKRGVSNLYVTPWHYYGIFMLTKTPFPSKFYSYGEKEIFASDHYLNLSQEQVLNPLIEKTTVFFGDSIAYGDDLDGWAGRTGRKNRMTWINSGISGATFSKNNVSACIAELQVPFASPDYIIFEGGTNDADRIGNATGDIKPEKFGTWSEDNYGTDDPTTHYGFDISTFCGAVEFVCKNFVSLYPSAKIGYIAAHKMGTVDATRANREYYIKTAIEICKKWGIPFLNLWDTCHLNPLIPSHYTDGENYMYIDGQHLTGNGYDYVSSIVNAWMKTL